MEKKKTQADSSEQLRKQTSGQEEDAVGGREPTGARTYVDPGVVHELRDGHSLIRVRLQEPVDQVFG